MNENVFFVPISALLGYIRTATSEGMKWWNTLPWCKPTLSKCLRFSGQRR